MPANALVHLGHQFKNNKGFSPWSAEFQCRPETPSASEGDEHQWFFENSNKIHRLFETIAPDIQINARATHCPGSCGQSGSIALSSQMFLPAFLWLQASKFALIVLYPHQVPGSHLPSHSHTPDSGQIQFSLGNRPNSLSLNVTLNS